ncbi:unnamed protein product [Spirodela intermedia]|uniref:Uncharacterized protein n=2 Tax=Spirodela intermedia TaxID=51605 RepID=A0A7I8K5E3_SPIIN|nr:unnamed protein product [Spirodela intermedia]CAA6656756.1 unnamed protein product [Spirodela intermedia]CAA7392676.1 unnamed protein product [Spirodela intermedia]
MASFADNMDYRDSDRSLSSGRASETGSRYVIESGLYMSSLAATVLISGLVIVGISLLTILVSLFVMLQSCQNKNSGVLHQRGVNCARDYREGLAFPEALGNWDAEESSARCEGYINGHIEERRDQRELNASLKRVEDFFSTATPGSSVDVVLMDIDDLFPAATSGRSELPHRRDESGDGQALARDLVRRLYARLQAGGWSLILFSRKTERQRSGTADDLVAAGYGGWSSLIMRLFHRSMPLNAPKTNQIEFPRAEKAILSMESWEYISRRRALLREQGFAIASVISGRMDALIGPCPGRRDFRLRSLFPGT